MTSHDVVDVGGGRRASARWAPGNAGPDGDGVLPLLLGKYTRLAQFFARRRRRTKGTIPVWICDGHLRRGGNGGGEVRALGKTLEELRGLAARFHGEMEQMPPVFSAKKIGGVPAHKLARAGKPWR